MTSQAWIYFRNVSSASVFFHLIWFIIFSRYHFTLSLRTASVDPLLIEYSMFVDHQEPRTDHNLHLSDKPSVRHSVDLSPGKMAMVRFDVLHL